jgi:hypothetical protein
MPCHDRMRHGARGALRGGLAEGHVIGGLGWWEEGGGAVVRDSARVCGGGGALEGLDVWG